MKKSQNIIISIISIVLVAFLGLSFLLFDKSEKVTIKAVKGSYAEKFANDNKLDFVVINDSENPDVEIPTIDETTETTEETTNKPSQPAKENKTKENDTFIYNYINKTVEIVGYKGSEKLVVIPETIDDLPVVKLNINPIESKIEMIEMPESVASIEGKYSLPRYTSAFYASVIIALIGFIYAIIATILAFKKAETNEKTFYGVPLVYNGFTAFIITIIVSAIAMVLNLPCVISGVIAFIVIVISAIGLVKVNAARELVEETGEKVKNKTQYIKTLVVSADTLMAKANNDETKAICKKVYEAVRYSDPMSTAELENIEDEISNKFNQFANAVNSDDAEKAKLLSKDILNLLNERNKMCKVLK